MRVSGQALLLVLCFPLMVITAWFTDTGRSVWAPVLRERWERFKGLWHVYVRSSYGRWLPHARHLEPDDGDAHMCTCPSLSAAFQLSPPDADGHALCSSSDHPTAVADAIEMSQSPPLPVYPAAADEAVAVRPLAAIPAKAQSPAPMAAAVERSPNPNLDVIEEDAVLEIEVVTGAGVGIGSAGVENIAYDATAESDTEPPPPVVEIALGDPVRSGLFTITSILIFDMLMSIRFLMK